MSILLWPFKFLWGLFTLLLSLTGRVLGIIIGLALVTAGAVLTLTIVGAVIGVPLLIIGILIIICAFS